MRTSRFLAVVAAGIVSLSGASAEEKPVAVQSSGAHATAAPAVAVAATSPESNGADPSAAAPPFDGPAGDAPPRQSASPSVKPPVPKKPVTPTLVVKINLSSQSMTLSYGGAIRETWKISSGREGYATPRGVFRPQWASRMWYSRKYDNAPMPHAVFFVGGVAIHGTQSTQLLGMPASHGCVRLAPGNAAHLYSLVHKHGYARTRIEVFGTPPATRLAKSRTPARTQAAMVASHRASPSRTASKGRQAPYGWTAPRPAPQLQRHSNGLVYLPPGSRFRGRDAFVYNGVVYRRVR